MSGTFSRELPLTCPVNIGVLGHFPLLADWILGFVGGSGSQGFMGQEDMVWSKAARQFTRSRGDGPPFCISTLLDLLLNVQIQRKKRQGGEKIHFPVASCQR